MAAPTTEFSPGDLARAPDPYALLGSVRAAGPVLRSANSWIVTGHAEAEQVLRCPAARSGFIAELYRSLLPPGAAREELGSRINFLDPPDHQRVRRLVSKAFTPRRIEGLRPFVERLCRELLAKLPADEPVDLVEGFAHAVPSLVISELLGVPVAERHRLTALADRVAALLGLAGLDPARLAAAVEAAEEMHATLRALVEERRRVPREDLLSALLAAEEDRERLSESELLSLAATLYSAGHRTTRDSFSNGLATLLGEPALVEAVRSGAPPAAAVVEEFLRFETPTHYVARKLVEPLAVAGVTIPPGEPIAVMLAAANRDPKAYPDADRFDPWRWTRAPAPPAVLSFAFGPHFCLGAHLARMENELMLRTLLAVRPAVALAGPLAWWHTGLFRGLAALPVRLGPHVARAPLAGGAPAP
jgi:cytochrome P450